MKKPPLTIDKILAWADAHHKRTGCWPTSRSGSIHGTRDENWNAVNHALCAGYRGLSRGLSLCKLLLKHRGKSAKPQRPVLTIDQILAWADAHHKRTGCWPTSRSGSIHGTRDENWNAVDDALGAGHRGLPRGLLLRKLLLKHRGKSVNLRRPALTIDQILAWADAHHKRTGKWPGVLSGRIHDAKDETWQGVDFRPAHGDPRLAARIVATQTVGEVPRAQFQSGRSSLTIPQILAWADEHHQRTDKWPGVYSGRISAALMKAGRRLTEPCGEANGGFPRARTYSCCWLSNVAHAGSPSTPLTASLDFHGPAWA